MLFTFKINEFFTIYGGVEGRLSGWQLELVNDGGNLDVHTLGIGFHFGLSFGGKRWFLRPEIGYRNHLVGFESEAEGDMKFSWFNFGLCFGFNFGAEDESQDKRIQELEDRLKKLEGKE